MDKSDKMPCLVCKGKSKVIIGKTNERKSICRPCDNTGEMERYGVYGIPEAFRFYKKGYQHDKKGYVWKERNFRKQGLFLIYHKEIGRYHICNQQFRTVGHCAAIGEALLMFLSNPIFAKGHNYRLPSYFRDALDENGVLAKMQIVATSIENGISFPDQEDTYKELLSLVKKSFRQGFDSFILKEHFHF